RLISTLFTWLARFGVALALIVVTVGAWDRLTDAGLGCPDWPGCSGQVFVTERLAVDAGVARRYVRPRPAGWASRVTCQCSAGSAVPARRAGDLSGPPRHVDGDAPLEADHRGRALARRVRDAFAAVRAREAPRSAVRVRAAESARRRRGRGARPPDRARRLDE